MSKIINLNQARKMQKRADSKRKADENAVRFGQSKSERDALQARADKARRDLDGHKQE